MTQHAYSTPAPARAGHTVNGWIAKAARLGYTAKGVVYTLIGLLAARAAFEAGGETTGSEGALRSLLGQPFGQVMLAAMAIGLTAYVAWRLIQTFVDPENKGTDAKGLGARAFYLASALAYGSLVVAAVRMLTGGSGGGSGTEEKAAHLMSQPFGRWLVGLAGMAVLISALVQLYKAYSTDFTKRLDLGELSGGARRWAVRSGRFGLAARGAVFTLIGGFLTVAAVQANPDKAKGLGETLSTLERQPYGPWVLAVVALGLLAYGLYQLVKARYRRIG